MCFDPRKASADALVKAWQERMTARDEAGQCADPDCWCRREPVWPPKCEPVPPSDGPVVLAESLAESNAMIVMAKYAKPQYNDGFAGSILARREARSNRGEDAPFTREEVGALTRRAKDAYARYQREDAAREARFARWEAARNRWTYRACWGIIALLFVAWAYLVAPSPTGGHRAAPSPAPSAPGPPQPGHPDTGKIPGNSRESP